MEPKGTMQSASSSAAPQVMRSSAEALIVGKPAQNEGGPGSGPHAGGGMHVWGDGPGKSGPHMGQPKVADAVDRHNDKVRKELAKHTIKKEGQEGGADGKAGPATEVHQVIKKPGNGANNPASSVGQKKLPQNSVPFLSKQSGSFNFLSRFKEASATADGQPGKRFRVTLLQEGMGNFKDAFYYTKEAIASAVPIFEGRQFFIDHPDAIEEQARPERSVRDLAGYFENVSADLEETGVTVLNGDLVILPDPSLSLYRTQMLESLAYSQKHPGEDLVGLSINASGDFDQVEINEFMASGEIPEACLAKLNEAIQKGVQVVRPVREMDSAVSCDLVTVAGAGGKINQLLEGGNKSMEKKEGHQAEDGMEDEDKGAAPAPEKDDADGQDGSHPDAAQDEELIKGLMQKYLGDGFSQEDHQMMQAYMSHAKEMGLEGKEAEDCAGHSMKMAKHMISKQAKQADPQEADGEAHKEADGDALDVHGDKSVAPADAKNGMSKKDQVAESAKGKKGMTEAVARIAKLEQEIESLRLEKATEKALLESGLPRKVTAKFRESILPTIKNTKQLEVELKKFKEAYTLGSATESTGFVYGAEKTGGFGETGSLASGFGEFIEE